MQRKQADDLGSRRPRRGAGVPATRLTRAAPQPTEPVLRVTEIIIPYCLAAVARLNNIR